MNYWTWISAPHHKPVMFKAVLDPPIPTSVTARTMIQHVTPEVNAAVEKEGWVIIIGDDDVPVSLYVMPQSVEYSYCITG